MTPATVADATPPAIAQTEPARSPWTATVGRALWSTVRNAIGSIDFSMAAFLTWLTVTMSLLVWTGIGTIGARRLSRRTATVIDDELLLECERARRVLGLRRTVDVGVSSDVAIPMVVGALHPRVVIPASAAAWTRERLRVVLLHELAHVRRRDGLWMLASRIVTSIFWFHPLVWVLSSHLRRDAERACDEVVLGCGVRGSDYAAHLVDIARNAMDRRLLTSSVLALAARSSLETRVVAILGTRVPRASNGRVLAAAACAAGALFVVIAAANPTSVGSAQITAQESLTLIETQTSQSTVETTEQRADFEFTVASAENATTKANPRITSPRRMRTGAPVVSGTGARATCTTATASRARPRRTRTPRASGSVARRRSTTPAARTRFQSRRTRPSRRCVKHSTKASTIPNTSRKIRTSIRCAPTPASRSCSTT
jgi:beta-lactamase regulating signal transducer with metallopeptidase domain